MTSGFAGGRSPRRRRRDHGKITTSVSIRTTGGHRTLNTTRCCTAFGSNWMRWRRCCVRPNRTARRRGRTRGTVTQSRDRVTEDSCTMWTRSVATIRSGRIMPRPWAAIPMAIRAIQVRTTRRARMRIRTASPIDAIFDSKPNWIDGSIGYCVKSITPQIPTAANWLRVNRTATICGRRCRTFVTPSSPHDGIRRSPIPPRRLQIRVTDLPATTAPGRCGEPPMKSATPSIKTAFGKTTPESLGTNPTSGRRSNTPNVNWHRS